MTTLDLAPGLSLPLDAVTRAAAIVGQRGTGKTSTAVVFVEEAARAGVHFAVIDPTGAWYGLSSNAAGTGPGLDCVVMGGETGDVPLYPDSGALVARLVVEDHYSVVLNLERTPQMKWTWETRKRFVAEFAEELYERNRSALSLVIDEAHRFAPQGSTASERGGYGARCIGAVTDVVTLGRRKGLGAVLISQRPAKINKDVFEQAEVMIAHRLMGANDRKQIAGWLDGLGEIPEDLGLLPQLEEQHALVYAPTLRPPINARVVKVRAKGTFDSSSTPEVDGQVVLPKKRAEVDLDALKARMAETLERQREEDPKVLKARIAELERGAAAGATKEDAARIATVTSELAGAREHISALEGDLSQREAEMEKLETRAAASEQAERLVADLRASLGRLLGEGVPSSNGAPAGESYPGDAHVLGLIREHAPAGAGAVKVAPVEALRKQFLERTANRLADRIRELPPDQREALLFLLGQQTFCTINSVSKALSGNDSGGTRKRWSDALNALGATGLVAVGGSGRTGRRENVEGWVRAELGSHAPTDEEIASVRDRALSLLQAGAALS